MADQQENGTRRRFVRAGTAAAIGAGVSRAAETLAVDGGSKAVRVSKERAAEVTRWPRYGAEEKQAIAPESSHAAATPRAMHRICTSYPRPGEWNRGGV